MELNHFAAIIDAVQNLLNQHQSLFFFTGVRMYQGFAVILIVWVGVQTALSAEGFSFSRFANLLLTIAFGYGMINYYRSPIPGFGRSFPDLVTDQTLFLANRIQGASIEQLQLRLHDVFFSLEAPGFLDGLQLIRYVLIMVIIILAETVVLAVISYGFVALSVVILLGPLFIPFYIVPSLEWLFWGWLKAFLQFAFYQVVAYAVTFLFGSLLITFLDNNPPPFDGPRLAYLLFPFAFVLLAFVYGMLQVPTLTAQIFSGRAGDNFGSITAALGLGRIVRR